MAEGALSIKLRCASWQQLATIYKRDLSHGTMFLRAVTPPPVGTAVRIDLTLPSATVIALEGVVGSHIQDPQRGAGVEITLSPIPASSVWLIESALASEHKRLATPVRGVPIVGAAGAGHATGSIPTIPAIHENAEVTAAEQDLVKALVSEAESLKKLNPFLVLGVGYEAGDADVRAAFGELTKRYHPDRFTRYESAELRQLAAEIFILIRDAYRKLGDAAARALVLQSLGKAAPVPRAVPGPHRAAASIPPPRATQRVAVLPSLPPVPGAPVAVMPPAPTAPVPSAIRPPAPATARGATRRPTGEPPPANPPAPPPAAAAPAPPPAPAPRRSTPSAPPVHAPSPRATTAPPVHTPSPRASTAPPVHAPSPRASTAPPVGAPGGAPGSAIDRKQPASPFSHTQPAPVLIDPAEIAALESLIDQGRLDEALSGYRAMAKRHASDRNVRAGAELCEGLLALAARDRLEAAQRFETALEIDPSNERAARELAEMRRQATNERKGLLSRLMGKKEP